MNSKNYNKNNRKFIQGLRSFKDILPSKVKRLINKKGQIYSETLDNWRNFVGNDLFDISFPKSFKNETQVIITVLQSDGENISDTWAGVGASSALLISDIPWNGPIATVRVGMIGTDFIFNPSRDQLGDCLFEMVVSGNKENIVMVEGEANEVKEEVEDVDNKSTDDADDNIILSISEIDAGLQSQV